MAHLLRGKQAGVQSDLSASLIPELFALDNIATYGVNSQINAIAYDPVQSLLAVGTKESRFGSGKIYVFGRKRICSTLQVPRPASITTLQFCADKLVSLDSKNDLSLFSLEAKALITSYAPPGRVTALLTDPSLDYALIGLQNGEIIAYDLDRQGLAPFRIPSLWKSFNPRARSSAVVTLALHPRDIGTLLVGYSDGAVIFSLKQNKATTFLHYELPEGAPGGYSDPSGATATRYPKLVHALWHPTGTFVLTGHDDESLVIWDPRTSRIIQARTLRDANVNHRGSVQGTYGSTPGTFALKSPLFRLAWCCKQNPDDTGIIVAGGAPTNVPERGLTFFDLGPTPVYQTSSWQVLSEHFEKPKAQYMLPTPPNTDVVDFCIIPRTSPHFAGASDPIAVIAILGSGELVTLSFPSGHSITPTNQLHPSLTFVHPFVNVFNLACIDRTRWLGMVEKRSPGPAILQGGAEATHSMQRLADRNIIQAAHADGTVRIWDAGHGDEIENPNVLQADVALAVGRSEKVDISKTSMSGAAGELAVGLMTGEVVIFRWDKNRNFGREISHQKSEAFGLEDIRDRADPGLREGLLPLTLLARQNKPVTALQTSDIGFVAVSYGDGSLAVIDLRGPALIHDASILDLTKHEKRASFRTSSSTPVQTKAEWVTVIEFAVMSLDGENYSSILLLAGTNLGRLITLKILPDSRSNYSVQLIGTACLDGRVLSITPINATSGQLAYASQSAVAGLQKGLTVNGVLVVATSTGVRIFKPANVKGASKTWDSVLCDTAAVIRDNERGGVALVGLFGDGSCRTFSIPNLKEIASLKIDKLSDVRRFSEAIITRAGDIFAWAGPSEIAVVNPWGTGIDTTSSRDKVYNSTALVPPRPTISNIQWISGTQYITPSDFDILIGGPDRPPSKQMIAQMQADAQQKREGERASTSTSTAADQQGEGYLAYMQRQVQERTQRLNLMGDSMDRLEDSSSSFANDVSKFVGQQKKKAVMGIIGSKFGL